jgi:hypothetical protein
MEKLLLVFFRVLRGTIIDNPLILEFQVILKYWIIHRKSSENFPVSSLVFKIGFSSDQHSLRIAGG